MTLEETKQKHMDQASDAIIYLNNATEKIYSISIKEKLATLKRKLQDLRDLQYWFDSGEKELDRLYNRYIPYLKTIIENYIKLETSWNHDELERVRNKLLHTLDEFIDTIRVISEILPQDEIDNANAEAKAKKAKEELDMRFRKLYEESN